MGDHRFKEYNPDQLLLLPQDMRKSLPDDHLALFVSDVVDRLDLSEIADEYVHLKGGRPGYHPRMMVKLGHVALDGTKVKANASKHKAMSYGADWRSEGGSYGKTSSGAKSTDT
jgi:transposase